MAKATRVHSTPPINTPIPDDPAPPRAPTPQQRADELLMRWRLARAAGIPAERRLDREAGQ
jgi:hypothetical protein